MIAILGEFVTENQLPTPANSNFAQLFAGNKALSLENTDTEAALEAFVIALARNQARIDHFEAMSAANDNTIH